MDFSDIAESETRCTLKNGGTPYAKGVEKLWDKTQKRLVFPRLIAEPLEIQVPDTPYGLV